MKKEFRNNVIALRKKQNNNELYKKSEKISNNLFSLDVIKKANTILTYLDFNCEVQTNNIISKLFLLNKKVLVPISIVQTKELVLSQIYNIDNEVQISTYGIREPKSEFIRPVSSKDVDVVLVPAVAFDENGYRLGYGGGFYDRFIETLNHEATTIGLAFELQIFDTVPKETHDAKMNYIVTENRIIKLI